MNLSVPNHAKPPMTPNELEFVIATGDLAGVGPRLLTFPHNKPRCERKELLECQLLIRGDSGALFRTLPKRCGTRTTRPAIASVRHCQS